MQRRELMNTLLAAGTVSAVSAPSTASPPPSRTTACSSKRTVAGPYIEAHDGTHLYWTQWGVGHPILFLNSAGMTTQMWDYQMVAFADHGYRCIAFDRRGHGQSDRPLGGYEYDTFADDIAAVVTALDLRELTIVGHSMACGEMVRYLTRHGGGRAARIVMLAPTTPYLLKNTDNPNGIPQPVFEALRYSWRKDYQRWIADNSAPFFVPETSAIDDPMGRGDIDAVSCADCHRMQHCNDEHRFSQGPGGDFGAHLGHPWRSGRLCSAGAYRKTHGRTDSW